jgi:hypothetical protein
MLFVKKVKTIPQTIRPKNVVLTSSESMTPGSVLKLRVTRIRA